MVPKSGLFIRIAAMQSVLMLSLSLSLQGAFAEQNNSINETPESHSTEAELAESQQEKELSNLRQLSQKGFSLYHKGDKEEAAFIWDQVLEGFESLPETVKTVFSIKRFVERYKRSGPNNSRLEKLLKKAAQICKRECGEDSPEYMEMLLDLSEFARNRKDNTECKNLLGQALAIGEKNFGKTSERLLVALDAYQNLLAGQKKEDMLRRMISIYEAKMEKSILELDAARDKLAYTLLNTGKGKEAEAPFRSAIDGYSKSMGPESILVASNLDSLAAVLEQEGKLEESEKCFQRSLEIKEKLVGKSSQFLLITLDGYARVLKEQSKETSFANELNLRAKSIRTSLNIVAPDSVSGARNAGEKAGISAEAKSYLLSAIKIIQTHAINRDKLDFKLERQKALELAKHARTPQDTYPAIRSLLGKLPDHHSALIIPVPVSPENPATKGTSAWSRLPTPENQAPPSGKIISKDGKNFAYLLVPGLIANGEEAVMQYSEKLRSTMVDLSKSKPDGWMVDLRPNKGGNNWPMLAALGPLLGDGVIGHFCYKNRTRSAWVYKNDSITVSDGEWLGSPLSASKGGHLELEKPPPVAVLIGKDTNSAGEIVAIAFKGRPDTRFFGDNTCGRTTAVRGYELKDQAVLFLAIEDDADRNLKRYPDGVHPDEYIKQEKDERGTSGSSVASDKVVETAANWLAG